MKKYIACQCENKMNEMLETFAEKGIIAEANVSVYIASALLPAKEMLKKSYSIGVEKKDYNRAVMLLKD